MTELTFTPPEASPAPPADPYAPDDNAPFGYMDDPATGERRPKKTAGRQKKEPGPDLAPGATPSIEDLKAGQAASSGADTKPGDRAPGKAAKKPKTIVPPYRAGIIAKGMNKRYRQIGKLVRPLDADIGQSFITMAQNTAEPEDDGDEADNSVGACWDDLARTNPRVRKFCLTMIQGGVVGALVIAHTPLGVAIAMKFIGANPGLIGRFVMSMTEPEPDEDGASDGPFGLNVEDLGQMAGMMEKLVPGMPGIDPAQLQQAAAQMAAQQQAERHQAEADRSRSAFANGGRGTRTQPKARTRAQRTKG